MAIYVYKIADGSLVSYCPNDTDPVADAATLSKAGLTALTGQPAMSATSAWDATTKAVKAVVGAKSVPSVMLFWQRFTAAEREAIENSYMTSTQAVKNAIGAFFRYVQSAGAVDCNDAYIVAKVQQLETAGIISAGRAVQILV